MAYKQTSMFPKHSSLFKTPRYEETKERMPFHIITWICPRNGDSRTRIFPQSPHQKDWKAAKYMLRCLKNLEMKGTSYHTETIERYEYIAKYYTGY